MRKVGIFIATALVLALMLAYPLVLPRRRTLRIFHAGSLSLALKEVEEEYERLNNHIDIEREASGSVEAVRKVYDLNKRCDVLFSADYRLIEDYLVPKYARWVIVFCSNELVLCYTDRSKYADEISKENWFEVLSRPGVKYGFSNPNLDPCGYRALAALYLASQYYRRPEIWKDIVKRYLHNVRVKVEKMGVRIYVPSTLDYATGGKLMLRDKSVDLVQLLEMGLLDYAFEYKSVAVERGLKYIELPKEFNLAETPFLNVSVVLYAGDGSRERTVVIKGIKYGLTVPTTCEQCREAIEFLKWFLYDDGKEVLERYGFSIIPYEFIGPVPDDLRPKP